MLNDKSRIRSGEMEADLSAGVDAIIDEFMTAVDALVEERHLQRGIARSQLPSSMVAILDKESLSLIGQFRLENRFASYFHRPDISLTVQQADNSARWEFGFEDPFIIQIPATLIEQSKDDRKAGLLIIASKHIDSEYQRLEEKLSLMRSRPIFGGQGEPEMAGSLLLLLPIGGGRAASEKAILSAVSVSGLPYEDAPDIRSGRAAVKELWRSINRAALILADLTLDDPAVMYSLGIAHTLGKETVLIYPQGSKYLRDIPKTYQIEYEESEAGRSKLEEEIGRTLVRVLAPIA
jgi:hypothetical protein